MSAAPAESLPGPARWIVSALPLCIGLAFVLCALLRPALLWESPKVQLGRRLLGDTPLSALMLILGVLLCAASVATALRLRSRA